MQHNKIPSKEDLGMFKKAYSAARRRANKKKLIFNITLDDMISQYYGQNGKCFYSNISMNITKKRKHVLHDPYKMTIDRRVQSLGYIKENIVWCLYCINSLKQNMLEKEVLEICRAVVSNDKKN